MTTPSHVPSYQDWARSNRGSGWIYLAGAAIIIGVWLAGSTFHVVGALFVVGNEFDPNAGSFGSSWATNFVSLVTFVPFFFATLIVVAFLHGRRWQSIITPFRKIRLRMIATGAALWALLMAVSYLALLPLSDAEPQWSFDAGTFLANLGVVIVVLFFQTTAEELFFRGYLGSWLSLRLKNAWVQALIIGLLFMLPHLANPEVVDLRGLDFLLAASTYFAVGFGWMFVSKTTGSIEIAIGAHFINNFIVMMIIGADNSSLGGTSLWTISSEFSAWDAVSTWVMVAAFVAIAFRIRGSGEVVPVMPPRRKPLRMPPPGWYRDPWNFGFLRYWNGYQWTPWTNARANSPTPTGDVHHQSPIRQ